MPKAKGIDLFAKLLCKHVRDVAISQCDLLLDPEAKGSNAERWRTSLSELSSAEFAKLIIPECIDRTVFHLLHAIDNGDLPLLLKRPAGKTIDLEEAGESEMAGWWTALDEGGWIPKYSKERFNSDPEEEDFDTSFLDDLDDDETDDLRN